MSTFTRLKYQSLIKFFMRKLSYYSALSLGLFLFFTTTKISAQEVESNESKKALTELKDGNNRFFSGNLTHMHQDTMRVKTLSKAQNPKAVIVSCSDSRVSPEIVFDQGLGDIFSIRTAGNVMGDYEEGSIEYAVEHLHTPLIIVMGHQGCGAIQALLENIDKVDDDTRAENLDHVSKIVKKLKSEEEEQDVLKAVGKNSNKAVVANVVNGVKQLRSSGPVLKSKYEDGEVDIVGAVYHIDSGMVEFIDF